MTRVFDVFPLGYETDVLLLRLETLADVVDEFCIVEGDRTFTGATRPYLWWKLLGDERFLPFKDRVSWHGVELHAGADVTPWEREYQQRGESLPAVDDAGCGPDDVVILGDADEIPNPDGVRWWLEHGDATPKRMPGYYHQLRLDLRVKGSLAPEYPWEYAQPLIGRRRSFSHGHLDRRTWPQTVGNLPREFNGWHFSCQGTIEDIAAKLRSFAHTELADTTTGDIEKLILKRRTVGHNAPLERVGLEQMPAPVQADPIRWMHLMAGDPR